MRSDETMLASDVVVEDELDQLYMELGKAYYEGAFEDPLPQLLPLFDKITRQRKDKELYREQNRVSVCPYCGNVIEDDAIFCGECGKKIN